MASSALRRGARYSGRREREVESVLGGLVVPRGSVPLRRFPLPAAARYSYSAQSFSAPRHPGVDIFAPQGTPVLAVEAGRAYARIEPKGGRVAYLESSSGWTYFYGHLAKWELPLLRVNGVMVTPGEALGKVGNSGNAQGTSPHLHFQARSGSTIVNPYRALREVDPAQARGPSSSHNLKAGLALLALAWAFSGGG